MEKIIVEATKRPEIGKKVKSLRKEGKIPAVIYGSHIESTPITLDKKATLHTLNDVSGSTILTIKLDNEEHAVLLREIQRDYLKNEIIHIDFLAVSLKEKLRTNVSLNLVGKAPVLDEFDALIVTGLEQVEVECFPQDLPESIDIDVSVLSEIGAALYVKDIHIPDNVVLLTNPEELVAVASAVKEEAVELEEEGVEITEDVIEEPEVIERGKTEESDKSEE